MRRCPTSVGAASAASWPVSTALASNSACWARQRSLVAASLSREQREIFEATPHAEVTGVIRAGFVAQDPIAVLIAADVLLGEGRLVVPAQHRMSGVALVQHGLQLALIVAVDASPEQMRRPIGAADQHAQLTGALEQGSERR